MSDERDPRDDESILDAIERRHGSISRIHLPDESGDESPILDARARPDESELSAAARSKYQLLGELARGGMGVILRGHDKELGRDVAVKVLHAELADRKEVVDRFVEEAQVGGQLQHPGIVPVYELGLMADQRPYFAMKLIKGRTLATMLTRRRAVGEDRQRFLAIFESVCRTIAYAHSKSVIHRDLKPANIMVGAFGEVQVVDWGLSKVLARGGVADELAAQSEQTRIETVRSGPEAGSESIVGNVLGTPAYMSPEQAQGAALDERTDVFALGAVLCEILTGRPPYVAGEGENVVQMAAMGRLDDARQRIESSDAAGKLKELCIAALLATRQARLASAEELADGIAEHAASLANAAQAAQLAVAEERVRAERSRRRLHLTVVSGVAALLIGAGAWWVDAQKQERRAELGRTFDELRVEALLREGRSDHQGAAEAAQAALAVVEAGDASASLLARARGLVERTDAAWRAEQERRLRVEREQRLIERLDELDVLQVGTDADQEVELGYQSAFGAFGIALDAPDLAQRLDGLRDTPLGARLALGFDAWARVGRRLRSDEAITRDDELLTGLGLDVDSDPHRTSIRRALIARDASSLVELARSSRLEALPPETLSLLVSALDELRSPAEARRVATVAADLHSSTFALIHAAGIAHLRARSLPIAETYLRASVAMRPGMPLLHAQLAAVQRRSGNHLGAVRSLTAAIELDPDYPWNYSEYALDLFLLGWTEQAAAAFAKTLERNPDDSSSRAFLMSCEYRMGTKSFEDLVTWAESRGSDSVVAWLHPAMVLCFDPPEGSTRDGERALAMLDPFLSSGSRNGILWMTVAAAFVLAGDGERAVAAAATAERWSEPEHRHKLAQIYLLAAAGHRANGNEHAAESLLARSRHMRAELVAGNEEAWSNGQLAKMFKRFERYAEGR